MRTKDTRINNHRLDIPGDDPAVSRLMAISLALAAELSVVRERLDTVERLAEKSGLFKQTEVEDFQPDKDATVARDSLRRRILRHVFVALRMDGEREVRTLRKTLDEDVKRRAGAVP